MGYGLGMYVAGYTMRDNKFDNKSDNDFDKTEESDTLAHIYHLSYYFNSFYNECDSET